MTPLNSNPSQPFLQFSSQHIILRALELDDLEFLYEWENSEQLKEHGSTLTPVSRFQLEQYILQSNNSLFEQGSLRLMIYLRNGLERIGAVDLYNFDTLNSRAETGIFIVPEQQGHGYAKEALSLMIEFSFKQLRLHQLYAYILPQNYASIALYEQLGFTHTATLKEWIWHQEQYADMNLYQLCNQ